MKNITLLLLTAVFIFNVFSNELLSKFHQNGFKIKDFRVELGRYNEKYLNFVEIKTFKYNRTTAVVNCTHNFKIRLEDKLEVVIQTYKFLSNEYRHFPVRFQVNLKKAFDSNAIGLGRIKNCGNISEFFFEKDVTYHTCNFVVDETQFPPLLPNGRFKVENTVYYLNEEVEQVFAFGEVYTPIPYPKN